MKIKVFKSLVTPVLMCGSEDWTLRKQNEKRILVAEMNWLRKMLGKSTNRYLKRCNY